MSEALKSHVQNSCHLNKTPQCSTVQQEYGVFGKTEQSSLMFILMNEIFLKME